MEAPRDQVGIRELRQNLSAYVREVRAGASFVVTERGRAVARLEPMPQLGPLASMIADHTATPPRKPGGVSALPVFDSSDGERLWQVLVDMRDEDPR